VRFVGKGRENEIDKKIKVKRCIEKERKESRKREF
jgi:hypothetical protein